MIHIEENNIQLMGRNMDLELIKKYALQSEQGKLTFPELLVQLEKLNVESYYADLLIGTKTYYSDSEASAVPFPIHAEKQIATNFNSEEIVRSLRSIQSRQIEYQEFLRQIMEAGVISYFVFIKGRKTIYFGRLGEQYVEHFPTKSKG